LFFSCSEQNPMWKIVAGVDVFVERDMLECLELCGTAPSICRFRRREIVRTLCFSRREFALDSLAESLVGIHKQSLLSRVDVFQLVIWGHLLDWHGMMIRTCWPYMFLHSICWSHGHRQLPGEFAEDRLLVGLFRLGVSPREIVWFA
jgi:hypothetical protein